MIKNLSNEKCFDCEQSQEIERIKMELNCTRSRFDLSTNPIEIEALIYKLNALEKEYIFLLKQS